MGAQGGWTGEAVGGWVGKVGGWTKLRVGGWVDGRSCGWVGSALAAPRSRLPQQHPPRLCPSSAPT